MNPNDDRQQMQRALRLGAAWLGRTAPNPCVGAVVLDAGGGTVGEGAHIRAGEPHAEIVALRAAGEAARGGTLYVTLEPCNHQGRTPPCSEAVIAAGVRRVVVGCEDPNPRVAGRGIARLREAGIAVEVGIESEAAADLIADFRVWIENRRPWVQHKVAATWDGATASRDTAREAVSGPESRLRVHELRARADAVLVGARTLRLDDPDLRPRSVPAPLQDRQPWRVAIASELPAPDRKLAQLDADRSWLICARDAAGHTPAWRAAGARVTCLGGSRPEPGRILETLWDAGVYRVLLEGGSHLARSFLDAGCIDWLTLIHGPRLAGGRADLPVYAGEPRRPMAEALPFHPHRVERVGDDWWIEGPLRPDPPADA